MRISNAGRWSIAALVVVVALIVAIWPRDVDGDAESHSYPSAVVDTDEPANADRIEPCPQPGPVSAPVGGPLAGLLLSCLNGGGATNVGAALAGKPALLNLWAYWCEPCATELPLLQDFAARSSGAVAVVTVHSDAGPSKALARLADLSVRLPGFQDGDARLRTAVSAPPALPLSVLVRADGSVAEVIARPFSSVDDIAAQVQRVLGVAT